MADIFTDHQPLPYTRGFGSFHFAPLDVGNHVHHAKAAAAAAAPPVKPPRVPSTFPFMKLPIEIRNKIYGCFVDELRGNIKIRDDDGRILGSEPVLSREPHLKGLHMFVFDRSFDSEMGDDNRPAEPMVVEGAPGQRNIDPRSGAPMDVLEVYKALRTGELDENDPSLPSNWKRCIETEADPWNWKRSAHGEADRVEPEAIMSDADDSEVSDWDSDEAEIADNLRRNVMPIVDDADSEDSEADIVLTKTSKGKPEVIEIVDSDESGQEDAVVLEDSDESDDEDYDPGNDEDIEGDRGEDSDKNDDGNDYSDGSVYHDSDYDKEYVKQMAKATARRRYLDAKPWAPRCYVAIYSRYLTSPKCRIHLSDDPKSLDFEDLWACTTCSHRDPGAYDNLRHLAQINPLIAVELGRAVWLGATVEFDGPETFLALVAERPAVLPLIRHVVLNLEINPLLPFGRAGTQSLATMLEIVTDKMDLDSFKVQLDTRHFDGFFVDSKPEPEWGSECRKEWAPLFRSLRTRQFLISTVDDWRPRIMPDHEVIQLSQVLDAWFKSLLTEWMPYSLQGQIEVKEEEEEKLSFPLTLRLRNSEGRTSG